ncbi:MAG: ferritin [Candidatus Hydrothermarchaeales archaeon]
MLNEKMEETLNSQLNFEIYSSYIYFSMSAYFNSINLPGFASWMQAQTQEELVHTMKLYNYINEKGGRIKLDQIDKPPEEWASPLAAFEHALSHEKIVTGRINDLIKLADDLKDQDTHNVLQWFVKEQVEEEESVGKVVQKLKQKGDTSDGMDTLDQELGTRGSA